MYKVKDSGTYAINYLRIFIVIDIYFIQIF